MVVSAASCGVKSVKVDEPYAVDPAYAGPNINIASLGSNCGIDNLKAICKGNELCNAYSLDTISTDFVFLSPWSV